MRDHLIDRFIGIPEHFVSAIHYLDKEGQSTQRDAEVEQVVIELRRESQAFQCPCGEPFYAYYDCIERMVRDLPWGPWPRVFLMVPRVP